MQQESTRLLYASRVRLASTTLRPALRRVSSAAQVTTAPIPVQRRAWRVLLVLSRTARDQATSVPAQAARLEHSTPTQDPPAQVHALFVDWASTIRTLVRLLALYVAQAPTTRLQEHPAPALALTAAQARTIQTQARQGRVPVPLRPLGHLATRVEALDLCCAPQEPSLPDTTTQVARHADQERQQCKPG